MRKICVALILCLLVVAGACRARVSPEQKAIAPQYQRIAIVIAPGPGADAALAVPMMKEVERMVPTRLGFLQKVDCLPNVPVDITAVPPNAQIKNKGDYDGIVTLIYSAADGKVFMDMTLVDAKTGEKIWSHQLATKDSDIRGRLMKHAYWTPTTIKQHFYSK